LSIYFSHFDRKSRVAESGAPDSRQDLVGFEYRRKFHWLTEGRIGHGSLPREGDKAKLGAQLNAPSADISAPGAGMQ
jgi:hypothetical protein